MKTYPSRYLTADMKKIPMTPFEIVGGQMEFLFNSAKNAGKKIEVRDEDVEEKIIWQDTTKEQKKTENEQDF